MLDHDAAYYETSYAFPMTDSRQGEGWGAVQLIFGFTPR
jgi:hypothetical protein